MAKITVPCDVCIKRYYRTYVVVDDEMEPIDIFKKMNAEILEQQDDALTPDTDLEIEDDDIVYIEPDWDASWTEAEEEEMKECFRMMLEHEHQKE